MSDKQFKIWLAIYIVSVIILIAEVIYAFVG